MNIKSQIINYLDESDLNIINLNDMTEAIGIPQANVKTALRTLVANKILVRLQRELYAKPSFSNQNVIAYNLCKDGTIAYWSALSFHGLTTQFSNTIFIQSPRRIMHKKVHGSTYKFIHLNKSKIGLLQKVGRNNNAFYVTSIEKTICDCFDKMEYSGGWTEVLKAFYKSKLNSIKLIEACNIVNNVSVIKRMGYLASFSQKSGLKSFIKFAKSKLNSSYDLLDNESLTCGNYSTEWMLDLNVSEEEIMNSLVNIY